jgi:hypothetical protein
MGKIDFLLCVVFGALLAGALAMTPSADSSAQFWTARVLFIAVAIIAGVTYLVWAKDVRSLYERVVLGGVARWYLRAYPSVSIG